MATLVVETGAGLATANSYCNEDEADLYHEKHYYASTWTSATSDNKEIALMWATRLIDEQVEWAGVAVGTTQALMWPRNLVYDRNGYAILSTTIPTWLKEATAEFARLLLDENRTAETNRDLVGFKEMKIGPLELKVDSFNKKSVLPPSVWSMIRFYCTKVGKSRRLVRI